MNVETVERKGGVAEVIAVDVDDCDDEALSREMSVLVESKKEFGD